MKNSPYNLHTVPFVIQEKPFYTLREACVHFRVPPDIAKKKLKQGLSLEEIFLWKRKREKSGKVVVHGKEFDSFLDACRKYKVRNQTVNSWISKGFDINEAFKLAEKSVHTITVLNQEFKSMAQACDYFGYLAPTIYFRTHKGYTKESAFYDLKDKNRPIHLKDGYYGSMAELAKELGIDEEKIWFYLERGVSLKDLKDMKF